MAGLISDSFQSLLFSEKRTNIANHCAEQNVATACRDVRADRKCNSDRREFSFRVLSLEGPRRGQGRAKWNRDVGGEWGFGCPVAETATTQRQRQPATRIPAGCRPKVLGENHTKCLFEAKANARILGQPVRQHDLIPHPPPVDSLTIAIRSPRDIPGRPTIGPYFGTCLTHCDPTGPFQATRWL